MRGARALAGCGGADSGRAGQIRTLAGRAVERWLQGDEVAGEATWRRPVGRGDASGGGAANGYAPSVAREVESGGAGEEGATSGGAGFGRRGI